MDLFESLAIWTSDFYFTGHGRYAETLMRAFPNSHHVYYQSGDFDIVSPYPNASIVRPTISRSLPLSAEKFINRMMQPMVTRKFIQKHDVNLIHYTSQHDSPVFDPNIKEVVTIHDITAIKSDSHQFRDRIYNKQISWNIRKALELEDIVTDSSVTADEIRGLGYTGRLHIIHICTNPVFQFTSDKVNVRKSLGLPLDKNIILSVSSSSARKNLSVVKKTLETLGDNYVLVRVGEEVGLKSEISFKNVDDSKLRDIYSAADVLLFPSKEEGFGIPMIEAMASGLPVVASNIPITKEILKDAGIFVSSYDPSEYTEAIIESLNKKEFYARKSLERSEQFSFEKFRENFHSFYVNMLNF